jgi:hypothetical protein
MAMEQDFPSQAIILPVSRNHSSTTRLEIGPLSVPVPRYIISPDDVSIVDSSSEISLHEVLWASSGNRLGSTVTSYGRRDTTSVPGREKNYFLPSVSSKRISDLVSLVPSKYRGMFPTS